LRLKYTYSVSSFNSYNYSKEKINTESQHTNKQKSNQYTSKDKNRSFPSIHNNLRPRKKGLIECLNPEDKIGKLYSMTPEGKELLQKLEEK
jgi:hypothetical protein